MRREGGRIGYDPWLHTSDWVKAAEKALAAKGATLVAVDTNPVDAIWPDRPAPSDARLVVQPDDLAGKSSAEKRAEIADWLTEQKADAVVLSALDSIAWALNVRGADVEHTPVALAYAIVNADGTLDLFVAPEKMSDDGRGASRQRGARPRPHAISRRRSADMPASASPPIPSARSRRSSTG